MSYDLNNYNVSLLAAADLSGAQYKCVSLDSSGRIIQSTATSLTIGVLQTKPTNGQFGSVAFMGVSKMALGGTVTAGARMHSNASGLGVAATTAGNAVIGIALEGGASGDVIPVLLGRMPFATLA